MTKPEIIFELLAEGGRLRIERHKNKFGEKFIYERSEMGISDNDLNVHEKNESDKFEEVFELINKKYTWYQLNIDTIHHDYKNYILTQLIDKLNNESVSLENLYQKDSLNKKLNVELIYMTEKKWWTYKLLGDKWSSKNPTIENPFFFSNWVKWGNRDKLTNVKLPGVYCIAVSKDNLENSAFSWIEEIEYIGMTNAISGLKGRLKQFDNTIKGKTGHGGADRFKYKYENYDEVVNDIYVAMDAFDCDVTSNKPHDLIMMGDVARQEYVCFAEYVKRFKKLPRFNDKKKSKKYSKTKGDINK